MIAFRLPPFLSPLKTTEAPYVLMLAVMILLCRWCITYNGGKSIGRNGCYGRLHAELIQPTVVTRPQPHNLMVRGDSRCGLGQGQMSSSLQAGIIFSTGI
jgi:hypothetical protein